MSLTFFMYKSSDILSCGHIWTCFSFNKKSCLHIKRLCSIFQILNTVKFGLDKLLKDSGENDNKVISDTEFQNILGKSHSGEWAKVKNTDSNKQVTY